jgi:hypothetical protein
MCQNSVTELTAIIRAADSANTSNASAAAAEDSDQPPQRRLPGILRWASSFWRAHKKQRPVSVAGRQRMASTAGGGRLAILTVNSKHRVRHPDSSPRVHPRLPTVSTEVSCAALRSNISRTPIDSSDFSDERPCKLVRLVRQPRGLGLTTATTSAAFFLHLTAKGEHRAAGRERPVENDDAGFLYGHSVSSL